MIFLRGFTHEEMLKCPICQKFPFFPSIKYSSWLTEDPKALELVNIFGNMTETDEEVDIEKEDEGRRNLSALNEVEVDIAVKVAA